ncbi:MAG: hypothetical protein LBF12_02305 [Christensenellaceae bacterium]|jgi:hypothetical protein|nr:hypothetical protein [Christensenellaceae bacterium]
MKNLHKISIIIFLIAISLVLFVSCSDNDEPSDDSIKSIEISSGLEAPIIINSEFPRATLKITYFNDDEQFLTISENMVTNFYPSRAGEQTLIISFGNHSISHSVTVINPIQDISIDESRTTMTYNLNQPFNTAYIIIRRLVGEDQLIQVTSDMIEQFSTLEKGDHDVKIVFPEFEKTYTINVIDPDDLDDDDNIPTTPGGSDQGEDGESNGQENNGSTESNV